MVNEDEIWGEMFDLIPKMQLAVRKALKKDIETYEHGHSLMERERMGLRTALGFIRKKWVMDIIYFIHLKETPYFSEIQHNLKDISSRSLTDRLNDLEEVGILNRVVQTGKPIHVYYELTEFGHGIYELIIPLLTYFNSHRKARDDS